MELSLGKFEELLSSRRLGISLIGMSNVGKSYVARALAADPSLGFASVCIDDLIEEKLGPFLKSEGFAGIDGVAEWMGQPYDPQYPQTQQLYLRFEEESMNGVTHPTGRNLVIDTTGSVIYTPQPVLGRLKSETLVVYLEATAEFRDALFRKYISNPKPVIWGDSFNIQAGESERDALERCYPLLLGFRAERYAQLADVTIPRQLLQDASGRQFLEEVKSRLPR